MKSKSDNALPADAVPTVFCCDSCEYEMPVKPDMAGRRARCPKCGQVGRVGPGASANDSKSAAGTSPGKPETPPSGQAPQGPAGSYVPQAHAAQDQAPRRPAEPTMRCPFCREEILLAARKCKHCGEFLDENLRQMMGEHRPGKKHAHGSPPAGISPRMLLSFAAIVVLLAGVGTGIWWLLHRGGNSAAAGASQANGDAPAAPSFESTFAATRKALEGTEVKDLSGSVTRFLNAAEGGAWQSSVRKADAAGKPAHAFVQAPYRLTSAEAKTVSSRGVLTLEFVSKEGSWQFQGASGQAWFVMTGGADKELPEDDRQNFRPGDYVLRHIKEALQKSSPRKDD